MWCLRGEGLVLSGGDISEERREDRVLARRLRAGNQKAWCQFYGMYASPLYRFALSRLNGSKHIAADVTQDAIVVALKRISTYDSGKGSLWSWVCGITVNICREAWRARTRDSVLEERLKERHRTLSGSADPDGAPDVLHYLVSLNPRYQDVLRLKYMEERSVREMAKQLGLSEKAVESRLTRAREAFRRAREDEGGDGQGDEQEAASNES